MPGPAQAGPAPWFRGRRPRGNTSLSLSGVLLDECTCGTESGLRGRRFEERLRGRPGPLRDADVALDHPLGAADGQLLHQEAHLLLLRREDLVLGRQLPQLALEGTEGLLPSLVQEDVFGLAGLALAVAVVDAPGFDL